MTEPLTIDDILSGGNTLILGATGSGKTLLAGQLLQRCDTPYVQITPEAVVTRAAAPSIPTARHDRDAIFGGLYAAFCLRATDTRGLLLVDDVPGVIAGFPKEPTSLVILDELIRDGEASPYAAVFTAQRYSDVKAVFDSHGMLMNFQNYVFLRTQDPGTLEFLASHTSGAYPDPRSFHVGTYYLVKSEKHVLTGLSELAAVT